MRRSRRTSIPKKIRKNVFRQNKKKPKKQLTPFERNQLIQKQMLLVEEKRKKDEAYSGRLDAIKNQVAVLNQQLDQLENVKPNYTK